MRFGHHQSFYLRVNWLAKAFKMVAEDPRFFYDDFGFEKIGLGRNMVKSLRYWSVATGMMLESKNEAKKPIHVLTDVGQLVRDYDRFVRLPLTAAVLHVLLATDKERASAWYWYFNVCNERSASVDELLPLLDEWAKQEQDKPVSEQSLRRDLECIRQMYTARSHFGDDPEEVVASPLTSLKLLQETRQLLTRRSPALADLDLDALYFSLLVYAQQHEVDSVTWEELQLKPLLWGRLFHMSASQILEVLEALHVESRFRVQFVRTNQLNTLNFEPEEPHRFLARAFERRSVVS
ncbi:DUF4007 family protein [Paenibacillus sp. H1-7]|uniref:DUF4007 family protein n=1 Tax=Paenibacillus sp. H1-7 TaxID=2282849 RepID=UPI001EF9420F|nr:DUF4007 family protein [Paenibacillus sp. H1-7]ULL13793.1 DUF4007 family protein [Paenibacillus sp. H1-7]